MSRLRDRALAALGGMIRRDPLVEVSARGHSHGRSSGISLRDVTEHECFAGPTILFWGSAGAAPLESYVPLTENLFHIDQAVARTEVLERQLVETRRLYRRDVAALRAEVAALRQEVRAALTETPSIAERQRIATDASSLANSLEHELRNVVKVPTEISSREVFDPDLGGAILEVTVKVQTAAGSFRDVRRQVMTAFEKATATFDPSEIVLLVRRAA